MPCTKHNRCNNDIRSDNFRTRAAPSRIFGHKFHPAPTHFLKQISSPTKVGDEQWCGVTTNPEMAGSRYSGRRLEAWTYYCGRRKSNANSIRDGKGALHAQGRAIKERVWKEWKDVRSVYFFWAVLILLGLLGFLFHFWDVLGGVDFWLRRFGYGRKGGH